MPPKPQATGVTTETQKPTGDAQKPRTEAKAQSLNEYYKSWERKVAGMKKEAASVDWTKFDFSKLQPSDIGVQFGPAMTEEQFKEYRKRTGGGSHVVKAPTKNS